MKWRVNIELDLGQDEAFIAVPVPLTARWARVQLQVQASTMTWSAGTAPVKWCNMGGTNPQPFATAVTLIAASPGSDRIPVSAVEHLVLQTGTAESGIKVGGVVVFDDQE